MSEGRYVLQTARLGLRCFVPGDAEALQAVFEDPYAAQFYPAMRGHAAMERWIAWNLRNYDEHGFGLWALELLATGQFIGDTGITWQEVEGERVLEIGWHVHPAFRCLGLATEAGSACLRHGFAHLKAERLTSIVDPANMASISVAKRVHAQCREFLGKQGAMLLFSTARVDFRP
jgi:RimJ/RimL family protein N-acetyltransferase